MVTNVFSSCCLCRTPLYNFTLQSINEDASNSDDSGSEDEDWRTLWCKEFLTHSSCLAIAVVAATDFRKLELFARLRNSYLRYDLFPLLTTIPDPACDPNQLSKDLSIDIVRQTNKDHWNNKLPEEMCVYIALELETNDLGPNSPIPALWSVHTKEQRQSNLVTIQLNVNIWLGFQTNAFWGSKIKRLPEDTCLVSCNTLNRPEDTAVIVRDSATLVVDGPPMEVIFYFNVASEQRY